MKKHRVRLRPKKKAQRRKAVGRFAAAGAGAGALLLLFTLKPWRALKLPALDRLPLAREARVDAVDIRGVSEGLARALRTAVDWQPGQVWGPGVPSRVARDLEARFPFVLEVEPQRNWSGHSVDFVVTLRRPLAYLGRAEEGPRFLGAGGERFTAPVGLFPQEGLPRAELKGLPADADLARVGRWLEEAVGPRGLPAELRELRFERAQGGWTLLLGDGTHLLWGDLRWTRQKLTRLREVLADASGRFGKGLTADLRHFEQGKILIRSE